MIKTVINIVIVLLLGLFVYWNCSSEEKPKQNKKINSKIDSLNRQINKNKRLVKHYKDSIRRLDSLYKSKANKRDSIKTVYVEKKIPAIDSFTVDSLIQYFRSRYEANSTP